MTPPNDFEPVSPQLIEVIQYTVFSSWKHLQMVSDEEKRTAKWAEEETRLRPLYVLAWALQQRNREIEELRAKLKFEKEHATIYERYQFCCPECGYNVNHFMEREKETSGE